MKKLILAIFTFIILAQSGLIHGNHIGKTMGERYIIIHNNLEKSQNIHVCHVVKTPQKTWAIGKAYCRIKPGGSRRFTGKGHYVIKTATQLLRHDKHPLSLAAASNNLNLKEDTFTLHTFSQACPVYADNDLKWKSYGYRH